MKPVKQNLLNASQVQQQQTPLLHVLATALWIRNTNSILPEIKNGKEKKSSCLLSSLLHNATFCLRY